MYLDRAVRHLRAQGVNLPDELLAHVTPLGWEHIALTGDYDWTAAAPPDGRPQLGLVRQGRGPEHHDRRGRPAPVRRRDRRARDDPPQPPRLPAGGS